MTSISSKRVPWALTVALMVFLFLVMGLAGLFGGRWLGERVSEPDTNLVLVESPTLFSKDNADSWNSEGGFNGFGGLPALPGDVLRATKVVDSEPGRLILESEGSTLAVTFSKPIRLFEIVSASLIGPGDVVVVRLIENVPQAVLVVPPDLEQGTNLRVR